MGETEGYQVMMTFDALLAEEDAERVKLGEPMILAPGSNLDEHLEGDMEEG